MTVQVRDWADLVAAGAIMEPRSTYGDDGLGAFAGTLMVGVPRALDGGHGLTVVAFPAEGGAVALFPRLTDVTTARELALRLRLRAGPGGGTLSGPEAEAGLIGRILGEGMPLRQATGESAFDALGEYILGGALDLAGLGGRTGFAEVGKCPEGGTWRRIITLEGLSVLSASGMPAMAARLALDIVDAQGDIPAEGHYALFLGDEAGAVAGVRVPSPDASPYDLPVVAGPFGIDPFDAHDGRIAELGIMVDAMLGRRHCLPDASPRMVSGRGPRRPS